MRTLLIAAIAGLLAGPALAQGAPPVRSGTSAGIAQKPLAPAGSAAAPVAPPAASASLKAAAAKGARPSYNLNEGPNRIGAFATGQTKPRKPS